MSDLEKFDRCEQNLAVLGLQLKHAKFEFQRGHREQYQGILDRIPLLVKILERDLRQLPTLPGGPQPARLGGDAIGGEAA